MVPDRNFRFKGLFGFSISSSIINYSYSFRLNTSISIHFNAFEQRQEESKNRYRTSILFWRMYMYKTRNKRYKGKKVRLYRTCIYKWKIKYPKTFFHFSRKKSMTCTFIPYFTFNVEKKLKIVLCFSHHFAWLFAKCTIDDSRNNGWNSLWSKKKSDVPQWLKKLKPTGKNGSQWNIFNDVIVDV